MEQECTARYKICKLPALTKLTGYQGRQTVSEEKGTNICYYN